MLDLKPSQEPVTQRIISASTKRGSGRLELNQTRLCTVGWSWTRLTPQGRGEAAVSPLFIYVIVLAGTRPLGYIIQRSTSSND